MTRVPSSQAFQTMHGIHGFGRALSRTHKCAVVYGLCCWVRIPSSALFSTSVNYLPGQGVQHTLCRFREASVQGFPILQVPAHSMGYAVSESLRPNLYRYGV